MTDWIAHYAAVKARIAVGRPRPGATPPAPVPAPAPAPPPAPTLELYKTNTAWVRLTRAEHAALPHVQARRAKLAAKAARAAEHRARYDLTAEALENLCADIIARHKTTWLAVTGRSTSKALMLPRAEVYKRLLGLGWSYSAIGKACGRDHSTIMYYVRRWSDKHDKA